MPNWENSDFFVQKISGLIARIRNCSLALQPRISVAAYANTPSAPCRFQILPLAEGDPGDLLCNRAEEKESTETILNTLTVTSALRNSERIPSLTMDNSKAHNRAFLRSSCREDLGEHQSCFARFSPPSDRSVARQLKRTLGAKNAIMLRISCFTKHHKALSLL